MCLIKLIEIDNQICKSIKITNKHNKFYLIFLDITIRFLYKSNKKDKITHIITPKFQFRSKKK